MENNFYDNRMVRFIKSHIIGGNPILILAWSRENLTLLHGLRLCCSQRRRPVPGGGGGRCTLIFSYRGRLVQIFGVQNFEFLGVFRKMNILGVWGFFGYFWGSAQNWTIFMGHIYAF